MNKLQRSDIGFPKQVFFLSILFVSLALFMSGCKSSKNVTSTTTQKLSLKTLSKNIDKNRLKYTWFEGRAKMQYKDNRYNQGFTANIRMKKDEVIWMQLTGFLGIEGGRALITPDSIKVINRLQKKYYAEDFSIIQKYLPFQMDFNMLQNFLVGNVWDAEISKKNTTLDNERYLVDKQEGGIDSKYVILPDIYRYESVNITHPSSRRSAEMQFNEYKKVDKQSFSFKRALKGKDGDNRIFLDMNFAKVKINEPLTFPFEVNPKYARARL